MARMKGPAPSSTSPAPIAHMLAGAVEAELQTATWHHHGPTHQRCDGPVVDAGCSCPNTRSTGPVRWVHLTQPCGCWNSLYVCQLWHKPTAQRRPAWCCTALGAAVPLSDGACVTLRQCRIGASVCLLVGFLVGDKGCFGSSLTS